MRPLSAEEIIDLWERGSRLHPIDRGLALLALGYPEMEWERLASLSIGDRDAALLALRRGTFGDRLEGRGSCPRCEEEVEFSLSIDELLNAHHGREEGTLYQKESNDGRTLLFRLPNSRDLAAILAAKDEGEARHRLAERCLSVMEGEEKIVLNDSLIDALSKGMEENDPLADVQLGLVCPECGTEWEVTLDILLWFWQELSEEARRLLQEVHLLASKYGWSEEAILSISPQRRRTYITMIL